MYNTSFNQIVLGAATMIITKKGKQK